MSALSKSERQDRPGRPEAIRLSIVVPIYNEEESIPVLYEEIRETLGRMGLETGAEVVLVDDCSRDGSLLAMLELQRADPRVRVVKFRRNFGQTAALAAGFDVSRGEVVVTLDGDLQNDPADIPRFVTEIGNGFDIVAGWRKKRYDNLVRRLPSLVANRLIALVTGVRIHDNGCTLKAFRRELVKGMSIYAEQHRFLPALSAARGARIAELVVNHRPRQFGSSKYGLSRATRVLLDLVTIKFISQFSHRPMQYFGLVSLGALLLGSVFGGLGLLSLGGREEGPFLFNEWEMVIVTVLAVLFSAFVFFAMLGLLAELAVKASGMHSRSTLDRILNELH